MDLIRGIGALFSESGIEVIAPKLSSFQSENDGFIYLEEEANIDPRLIELRYLQHLKALGRNGFSYFVNPDGYLGRSASYELGIAQATGINCYFFDDIRDLPVYYGGNSVWQPQKLADFIIQNRMLPKQKVHRREGEIRHLWQKLILPGAILAVGAIIEYRHTSASSEIPEVLFVQTHKWGGRWSVIGERVKRNEKINHALRRGIYEETRLQAKVGRHICTFDQLPRSGYYVDVHQIFADKVVEVSSRSVKLDTREAQNHLWIRADEALRDLPLEPNARHTLKVYLASRKIVV